LGNIKDHALEYYDDEAAEEIEETLWWLIGRRTIIRRYFNEIQLAKETTTIMDIGCGSGGNLAVLSEYGTVFGVEVSPTLARRATARHVGQIIQADFRTLDSLDHISIFTLFDVIEHIEDDNAFINNIPEHCSRPHYLLISVPACPFLYSQHDKLLHHHRRYSRRQLHTLLTSHGYDIITGSCFLSFLFPFVLISRFGEKLMALLGREPERVNLGRTPNLIGKFLIQVLNLEACLSNHITFPIGAWLFVIAKYTPDSTRSNV
jgi:SAM-dependent methyltransferase